MNNTKATSRTNSPAEVVITVTEFRPVLSPELRGARDTGYTMKLKGRHPRVSLKDDTLVVKAPGAVIRLTIAAAAGDKTKYYPAGITFVREDSEKLSEALRLGRPDLLQRKIVIDGQTLTFTDRFKKGTENTLYKFSVILQRGTDGAIGIIDPGIENDNGH
ncbi:MAG: hypothetical protein QM691_14355 [Opitutaceae bacterium]